MLKNLYFVIVEPKTPGNIGSICRACKTMGISNLVLVNPVPFLVDETFKLGWGAEDLIHSAKIVPALANILPEMHLVIGTTQRRRKNQPPMVSAPKLFADVMPISQRHKVAILFGREDNGLTDSELRQCHRRSSIPKAVAYPALNLSQAVMIYAYEAFQAVRKKPEPYRWKLATASEQELIYVKIAQTVPLLPFKARSGPDAFADLFRRVLGRAQLESRDVKLFLKVFELVQKMPRL